MAARVLSVDPVTGRKIRRIPSLKLEKIGSAYGGWITPTALLKEGAVCYCAGVGEDITFDLGLVSQLGCTVYAFDPTPRAVRYAQHHGRNTPGFRFFPVGLWDRDEVLRFHAPSNPEHVSHSVLNLQRTDEFFEAECRSLPSLMRENGHQRIDLLKLDIEGAEFKVIDSIIENHLDIGTIAVEYHDAYNPLDEQYGERVRDSLTNILDYGYSLVAVDDNPCNYTLVRSDLLK